MRRFLSLRDFDWVLLSFVLMLSGISVLEIYSATMHTKFSQFYHMQIINILIGLALMFVMSVIDYHRLLEIAWWAYGLAIAALLAVMVVGKSVMGARRWISFGHGIHFQPSEWVKLILIIAVARFFSARGDEKLTWAGLFKAFALVGIPMLLVLKQPDLGTALTYSPILIAGILLGGLRWRQAIILVLVFGVAVVPVWRKVLKPYQKQRLVSFLEPDSDPRGHGYQIRQSLIAVGSGGIWGKGVSNGSQTQGDFLPISYADFIFAAFCEEHGFVGAVLVLLLYFLVLMRLIQNAQTASDLAGSFIVMGVVAVVAFQIAVNVGMVLGLMPVTGIPLPLMSYGGTSLLFTFLALGMVMNVRMGRFVN
jgi:rod shape determining protein RodA